MENKIPKLVTIKQLASMGILSEYCIRNMVKSGKIRVIFSGKNALINLETFLDYIKGGE